MTDLLTIYKIRIKGTKQYSRGRITMMSIGAQDQKRYGVQWKTIGKEWKTEKALKEHLLKCILNDIDMSRWEVMEFTQQPSKSMNEWFDAKMTMARLKHV